MEASSFFKHRIESLIVVEEIVTVHILNYPADFVFPGERHDFWEFLYVDSGRVVCNRGGADIPLSAGRVIFHRPDEFHAIRADGAGARAFVVSFVSKSAALGALSGAELTLPRSLIGFLRGLTDEAQRTFTLPQFDPYLTQLPLLDAPELGGMQMLRLYLEQFLIGCLRLRSAGGAAFIPAHDFDRRLAAAVDEYLADNLYEKLSLNDVCKHFHYGKTYLCAHYKAAAKSGIMSRYAMLKAAEAERLIRESTHTLSDIAAMLRYESYAHFCKQFKKATGCPPGLYRERFSH